MSTLDVSLQLSVSRIAIDAFPSTFKVELELGRHSFSFNFLLDLKIFHSTWNN